MGKKEALLLLLILSILLLVLPQPTVLGGEMVTVEGTVKGHSTSNPLPNAKIMVLSSFVGWETFYGEVDSHGYFSFKLPGWEEYIIYAYYDNPLTPGFDYVPAMNHIQRARGNYNLTFELWDGASMFLEGEALFVETTETPQSSYSLQVPGFGEDFFLGEYLFNYGGFSSHYEIPGVSPSHIIVPADTPYRVKVGLSIKVGKEFLRCSFVIDKPGHFLLGKGETVNIDLREHTLPSCLSVVRAEASKIRSMIDEKEAKGFYLAVERQRFAQVTSFILEAEGYLSQGAYEVSFTRLRYAYTEMVNLRNWLNSMYREALISVFLLIPFLAFTAATTSHLLFEGKTQKISGASTFYVLFLLALYLLYPGSRLIEASLFLGASLLSLLAILGLATWVPGILKGKEVRGRVPLRNMIVPVFSVAKRSLRRRRYRSALTFITVVILVSSFIALTSFTTGFGLTFKKISNRQGSSSRLLVRALRPLTLPRYYDKTPYERGSDPCDVCWYPPLDNSSMRWFEERSETILVAPKIENLPIGGPLGYIGGLPKPCPFSKEDSSKVCPSTISVPIYGMMGIFPSAEVKVLSLNETIVEGRFLRDGDKNGVLISLKLKDRLKVTVGESLILYPRVQGLLRLEIIGIFDDNRFEELRDLDGRSPIPWKLKIASRIYDHIVVIEKELAPCSTSEVLVVTWETALEIDEMYLSRLDIVCEEGNDVGEYTKMLVLNKGFRVWANLEDGIYLAQLWSYYEGKGLPIAVPWGIVVLNVVVTMLSALYERRREINIYSAIGMNPSHISGAFLAEAVMIGVLGSGVGYLVGLGWYKVMFFLELALQVKQKVSALWVLGAIAVSLAAVLTGGLAALKGSVVITPSLKRKWSEGRKLSASLEPLELNLPVRITKAEAEGFVKYVVKKLRLRMDDVDYVTRWIGESREELEEASHRAIKFTYQHASPHSTIYTSNKILLRKEEGSEVLIVKLLTVGHPKGVQRITSIIRKIIMEWSIERGKLEG